MVAVEFFWGTLGPESIGAHRRVRTLGLARAVRAYNQAAVPGTGSVWYAKQLVLAALGIRLATELRKRPIRVANTIEALACLLGASETGQPDGRLRGRRKLAGRTVDASYKQVSNPSFYVSTPMRMGMAEPLIALDLAVGENGSKRFNALQLTDIGDAFLDKAIGGYSPNNTTVDKHLRSWVAGGSANNNSPALRRALSPAVPLRGSELAILVEQLGKGEGAARRLGAMAWVRNEHRSNKWDAQPAEIADDHWNDLQAGARFFALRAAALECLDAVEDQMRLLDLQAVSVDKAVAYPAVEERLGGLKRKADYLLSLRATPVGTNDGKAFAERLSLGDFRGILQFLAERDGRVLVRADSEIRRGFAFSVVGRADIAESLDEDPDTEPVQRIELPAGISRRVRDLALLCKDLDGTLDGWIKGTDIDAAEEVA